MNIFAYAFNWLKKALFESPIKYEDGAPKVMGTGKCPVCKKGTVTDYHNHGLVEITYDWYAGGPIGPGIHVQGTGKKEYQFHYNSCTNKDCSNWEMIEYRETPSWWDDLWNLDCPFTKGNIIEEFKNNKFGGKKYKSHNITRW